MAYTGSNSVIIFNSVTFDTTYRNIKDDDWIDKEKKSAGADTHESYFTSMRDSKLSLEFLMDGTVAWSACVPGMESVLIHCPEGIVDSSPRYITTALVKRRSRVNPYNDLVVASVVFQKQSAWAEAAQYYALLESGGYILSESGGRLLME